MKVTFIKYLWVNKRIRGLLLQTLFCVFVVIAAYALWQNVQMHLKTHTIKLGFKFLQDPAGFSTLMHLIDYSEQSSYGRAFVVGLLNTLLVSGLGIIFATIIGLIIGIARISTYHAVALIGKAYVEVIRNIPLLLQLFFWYFVVLRAAPSPQHSISFFDHIFITNRGIYFPTFTSNPTFNGLNFEGGVNLLPELLALLIALSLCTASYIAELVRLGIISVAIEQKEAAIALGLTPGQSLRHIIIPQALKVVLPPLTNQYINLTKNSSLAVAIAYPDLVSIFAGTVLNQTGHAIEIIIMTMGVYLIISLIISAGMLIFEKNTKWS